MAMLTREHMMFALFELDKKFGFETAETINDLKEDDKDHLQREAGQYLQMNSSEYPDELRELLVEKNLIMSDKENL